ncbi:MAG: hypothetical protein ACI96P_000375, partial [Candidatus Azotimanducaceae bacterium]
VNDDTGAIAVSIQGTEYDTTVTITKPNYNGLGVSTATITADLLTENDT